MKHKHKFILGSMEVKGKTFAQSKHFYFCKEKGCKETKEVILK